MQFVGAGLSKTGTSSLTRALEMLGFRTLHWDTERLACVIDGTDPEPDFRVYDDIDAVVESPAAFFFEELLEAYPDSRCILTVRDEDAWWDSIRAHYNDRYPNTDPHSVRSRIRSLVFGSATAIEHVYRKRYRQHNERVLAVVPPERLLVLDVTAPDAFAMLGSFVGRPVPPGSEFPYDNRADAAQQRDAAAKTLSAATPAGSTIALADGGWWWEGLALPDRYVTRVDEWAPWWGSPPDGPAAKELVVTAAKDGLEYFALAAPAFWWLDHHPDLAAHLAQHTQPVHRDWQMAVYRLST